MPKAGHHEFTPIDDEKTVMRYIRYMEDLNCRVHCAVRETDIRFETSPIRIVDDKVVHLRMPNVLLSPEKLREQVKATESQCVDISFTAHDILIFAATKVRKIDKDGISLTVERPIYKLQRRQNLRVKPGRDVKCKVTIHDSRTHRHDEFTPYDISVSGFSILFDQDKAEKYKVGDEISNIAYLFGAHEIRINAHVKNKIPVKNGRKTSIKVGFSISSIPTALEHEISRYAYLASQKILGRRI